MEIVPSGLEFGERPHFLDKCIDVHGEALPGEWWVAVILC